MEIKSDQEIIEQQRERIEELETTISDIYKKNRTKDGVSLHIAELLNIESGLLFNKLNWEELTLLEVKIEELKKSGK